MSGSVEDLRRCWIPEGTTHLNGGGGGANLFVTPFLFFTETFNGEELSTF